MRPNSLTAVATRFSTLSEIVISTLTARAKYLGCVAYFLLSSATTLTPSSLMSAKTTPLAPASANANAVSLPIPLTDYEMLAVARQ